MNTDEPTEPPVDVKTQPIAIPITKTGVAIFTPSICGVRHCIKIMGYEPTAEPPGGPYRGGTPAAAKKPKDNPFRLVVSNPLKVA